MNRGILTVLALAGMSALAGCGPAEPMKGQLGRSQVLESIDSLGGLAAWRKVRSATAIAVVTSHTGQRYTDRQRQVIDFKAGTAQASSFTPRGRWDACANHLGVCSVQAQFPMATDLRLRICDALAAVAHRSGGPLNFFYRRERAGAPQPVTIQGMELIRVPVVSSTSNAVAYYFDATTNRLKLVTAGADEVGCEGTVTVYDYMELPGGMVFPCRIRVVRIGEFVLVGDQAVLDVEFSDVRLHR